MLKSETEEVQRRLKQAVLDRQDTLREVEVQVLDAGDLSEARANLRDFVLAVHARNVESFGARFFLPPGQSELDERRGYR